MVIKGANALSSLCAYSSSSSGIEGMLQAIGVSVGLVVFIYLAINILFLVLVGNIAKSKGLSSLLWSILALIFGFPILIIVLILPNYDNQQPVGYTESSKKTGYSLAKSAYTKNQERKTVTNVVKIQDTSKVQGEKWVCSKCGELNKPGAQNCINCFAENSSLNIVKKTVKVAWTCPNCGEKNVERAQNCINCYTKKP